MTQRKSFVISDLHLGHKNILTFLHDGKPLRSFSSIEEMHEHMIQEWNKVVRPQDKVYVLGDVVIKKDALPLLTRFQGHKTIIGGNHDVMNADEYLKYFENMRGVRVFPYKCVLTHVPIHPESLRESFGYNIHGHLHGNVVKRQIFTHADWDGEKHIARYTEIPDSRYISACVEQPHINYIPREIDELVELRKQGKI